ncbi:MAG TPA: DUF6519 domain-containing protein [Verrucomicrobiae bacterium]|jgi:hypothetical protein
MSFDCSRVTFNPWDDYLGVVMQQGRVQLDSDWNEWLSEFARRIQAGTLDTFGRAAYPKNVTPAAFQITASVSASGANQISIGPGRMYVDGLLAENHGARASAQWDPALAELSGSPQPPPATPTGTIDFTAQPYYPGATLSGNGPFLAYLDVWIRAVTYLEHQKLVDKAVGVDTTGRLQTVWQVKTMSVPAGTTCSNLGSAANWPPAPSAGQLTTGLVPSAASGPCCLNAATGYTGMENQLYRVEIHQAGAIGTATFKWSRDNASIATLVTAITTAGITNSSGTAAAQLTAQSLGRDQVLGFMPGDWIEIIDNNLELTGQPGELHKIDSIDPSARTITLVDTLSAAGDFTSSGPTDPKRHVRITKWNQAGQISSVDSTGKLTPYGNVDTSQGAILVPPAGAVLHLENGITVAFGLNPAGGAFNTGDYWNFAARTADASVEHLHNAPPLGIHHHYAPLSVVTFNGTATPTFGDCRTPWPPTCEGGCGCCTYTVGADAQYQTIQAAVNAMPSDTGGEICILPGRYFENVIIQGKRDMVIHGCGWQTRVASASLQTASGAGASNTGAGAGTGTGNTFTAVITITDSEHIELRSFAVEAAPGEVGILVDGTGNLAPAPAVPPPGVIEVAENNETFDRQAFLVEENLGVVDLAIEDLLITATTLPAILADFVRLLRIDNNRIAMGNLRSQWPAVYVRGAEIHVDRNWIGILDAANLREWFPVSVSADLLADANNYATANRDAYINIKSGALAQHPGGIQVAGPSEDVFILENEIEGGARNGITLGNLELLNLQGPQIYHIVGVLLEMEDCCSTTGTLEPPGSETGGSGGSPAAGGRLVRIQIARNRIREMGLCGIGPAAFFNLRKTLEVISIEDLLIEDNTISNTLLRAIAPVPSDSVFGYGAICAPDVEDLIIRDNIITNFGEKPGVNASGIYVLHGEMVEISRNQVLETRDWTEEASRMKMTTGPRGGILVGLVTPPTLTTAASNKTWTLGEAAGRFAQPIYTPTLPALRVEHNVVRVPLGQALAAYGTGPFAIVNNHFASGGTIRGAGSLLIAQTVLIINLGAALEAAGAVTSFTGMQTYGNRASFAEAGNSFSTCGTVLFCNNECQLEKRFDEQAAFSSVAILTLDSLIFSNNHCWLDAGEASVFIDACLFGATVQMTGNRLQEPAGAAGLSGWSLGAANITSQNITTNCLVATAFLPKMLIKHDNLALIAAGQRENPCAAFSKL